MIAAEAACDIGRKGKGEFSAGTEAPPLKSYKGEHNKGPASKEAGQDCVLRHAAEAAGCLQVTLPRDGCGCETIAVASCPTLRCNVAFSTL